MEDKHGSSDRPTEEDVTVAADVLIGEDTVRIFLHPINDALAAKGQKKCIRIQNRVL
jgi:hypothetical protein